MDQKRRQFSLPVYIILLLFGLYFLYIANVTLKEKFPFVIGRRNIECKCQNSSQDVSTNIAHNFSTSILQNSTLEQEFTTLKPENLLNPNKSCPLPLLDPWDRSILWHINPAANPMEGCKVKYEKRSYLNETGHLWILDPKNGAIENETCYYRCKHSIHDHKQFMSNWTIIERTTAVKPNCDIMDIKCYVDPNANATYKFEHIQIVENGPLPDKPKDGAFDVHILIIDSVSNSQFIRAFPQTNHYIQSKLGAIPFPHLNKVGQSSRYNGYAILMGDEQLESTSYNFNTKRYIKSRAEKICEQSLNNMTLFVDYKRAGYRTMHFEDSANVIFIFPRCTGFTENQIEHNMRPFVLPFNGPKEFRDQEMFDNMLTSQCKEHHTYVLDVLSEFASKYKNEPKFSLSWLVWLAHDNSDTMYHADAQFRLWFKSNWRKFSNSFVFFMADHGQKAGSIMKTEVGKLEDKNPFLYVMLPEKLKANKELVAQMRQNAKQLVSHYDLHATLVEILENSHNWTEKTAFNETPPYKSPNKDLLGSSLFHKLKQPRNCESLGIPFQYCMCESPFNYVNDSQLLTKIARMVVEQMNKALNESSEHAEKCAQLTVDESVIPSLQLQVYQKDVTGRQKIRAEFKVQPSGGLYAIIAEKTGDEINLLEKEFPRLDRYHEQTKCIGHSFLKNYCYCKDLLKN